MGSSRKKQRAASSGHRALVRTSSADAQFEGQPTLNTSVGEQQPEQQHMEAQLKESLEWARRRYENARAEHQRWRATASDLAAFHPDGNRDGQVAFNQATRAHAALLEAYDQYRNALAQFSAFVLRKPLPKLPSTDI